MNTMIAISLAPSPAPAAAAVSSYFYASPVASSVRRRGVAVRCAPDGGSNGVGAGKGKLMVVSPVVIVEAPVMLKTAASVPSLRHNDGQTVRSRPATGGS
uniref:Uncharacterized protein n=1 Tax=Oryza brachyantha TaxID=4533 RepID=J3MIS6_ORYBR